VWSATRRPQRYEHKTQTHNKGEVPHVQLSPPSPITTTPYKQLTYNTAHNTCSTAGTAGNGPRVTTGTTFFRSTQAGTPHCDSCRHAALSAHGARLYQNTREPYHICPQQKGSRGRNTAARKVRTQGTHSFHPNFSSCRCANRDGLLATLSTIRPSTSRRPFLLSTSCATTHVADGERECKEGEGSAGNAKRSPSHKAKTMLRIWPVRLDDGGLAGAPCGSDHHWRPASCQR
jgi:hypothetical protein